jgi:hypothetical protein
MATQLDVLLHDRLVGTITNLAYDTNVFAFDEGFRTDRPRQPSASRRSAIRSPASIARTSGRSERASTRTSRTCCRRVRFGATSPSTRV